MSAAAEALPNDAAIPRERWLEMYRRMGLFEGIRIVRSSDAAVRTAACDITECFVDVPHQGEIVRARIERASTYDLHGRITGAVAQL